jgi:AcrR family transcriptional regulator
MPRPRSEEARRKVLVASATLMVERGAGNLSIEEVAARSGVAKTTIYRHWPDRSSLMIDTVRATIEHVGVPDTGTLRGDLDAYFGAMVRSDLDGGIGQLMPCLLEAASRDDEIEGVLDRLMDERRAVIERILRRAQARDELPDDLDMEIFVGTVVGPIVFRKVVQRRPLTPEYISGCLDVALTGLVSRSAD